VTNRNDGGRRKPSEAGKKTFKFCITLVC